MWLFFQISSDQWSSAYGGYNLHVQRREKPKWMSYCKVGMYHVCLLLFKSLLLLSLIFLLLLMLLLFCNSFCNFYSDSKSHRALYLGEWKQGAILPFFAPISVKSVMMSSHTTGACHRLENKEKTNKKLVLTCIRYYPHYLCIYI